MRVTLVSLGGGLEHTVTAECAAALREAGCIIGARRLLEHLPQGCTDRRIAAVKPQEVLDAVLAQDRGCAVVYSGDAGFYSGARGLLPLLAERDISARVLPGVSSVQLLAARLGLPWQDWALVSAHGTDCDPVAAVSGGRPAFFLTGGALGPGELCRRLTEAGLGDLSVTVGENLSARSERIVFGTAAELAGKDFPSLSVLLAEAAPRYEPRCPGIPDGEFVRGQVPMTKQEVRAAALAKLAVRPGQVLWDVGAGPGRAPGPRVRRGVRGGGLRPDSGQQTEIFRLEFTSGRGEGPPVPSGSPRPGRGVHRGHQGGHGGHCGRGPVQKSRRPDLYFRHRPGDAVRRRVRPDGPGAGGPGGSDRRQPDQGGGEPPPADGGQSHLPDHGKLP